MVLFSNSVFTVEEYVRNIGDKEEGLTREDKKENDAKKDEYIEIVQQVMCTINEDKVTRDISKNTMIEDK